MFALNMAREVCQVERPPGHIRVRPPSRGIRRAGAQQHAHQIRNIEQLCDKMIGLRKPPTRSPQARLRGCHAAAIESLVQITRKPTASGPF